MTKIKTHYHERTELEKGFHFAQATKAGNLLFISGCISWDADGTVMGPGDWPTQVRNVYENLKRTLAEFGATFENVVKETVYTTDMEAIVANAGIRTEFLKDYTPPASTWVEIKRLVNADLLLEVEMTAVLS